MSDKPDFTQNSSFPNFQRGYHKIILTILLYIIYT